MFSRFSGFGLGHKSTRHLTKVFRDEIREAFRLGHGKEAMGEIFEETQRRESNNEKEFKGESDGDNDLEENSVSVRIVMQTLGTLEMTTTQVILNLRRS